MQNIVIMHLIELDCKDKKNITPSIVNKVSNMSIMLFFLQILQIWS